jgi:hypothetical protein
MLIPCSVSSGVVSKTKMCWCPNWLKVVLMSKLRWVSLRILPFLDLFHPYIGVYCPIKKLKTAENSEFCAEFRRICLKSDHGKNWRKGPWSDEDECGGSTVQLAIRAKKSNTRRSVLHLLKVSVLRYIFFPVRYETHTNSDIRYNEQYILVHLQMFVVALGPLTVF